jgi:hypothetical protein
MSTSQNLQAVKGELDFLVALFATNSLIPEERTKLLRQMRVLLVEMDALASTALDENKLQTVDLPCNWSTPNKTANPLEDSAL